jgi:hypothetical protein
MQQKNYHVSGAASFPVVPVTGIFPRCRLRRHRSDRKPRQPFTPGQLAALEQAFCRQPYLSIGERSDVAESLGIDEQRVKIWFQNRRAKCRRIAEACADERNRTRLIVAAAAAAVAAAAAAAGDKPTTCGPFSADPKDMTRQIAQFRPLAAVEKNCRVSDFSQHNTEVSPTFQNSSSKSSFNLLHLASQQRIPAVGEYFDTNRPFKLDLIKSADYKQVYFAG